MLMPLLGGCSTPAFDRLAIPDVIPYSAAMQTKAAHEMKTCTNCETMILFINDYGVMRDQARAARGVDVDLNR